MSAHNPNKSSLEVPSEYGGVYGQLGAGYHDLSARDPRTSSTQSLTPSEAEDESDRRKLLIIYIHGFMGNDTSFQSFPAHVHKYLKLALAETHVIHSKIYPKYKTYKSIEVARDNFSAWLQPHEAPTTDVVLVGHSMGGLLAADVVLMGDKRGSAFFQHRILGTVNLDAPLLGLHPGIIKAGLASIFRSKPEKPKPDGDTSGLPLPSPSAPSPESSPSPPLMAGPFPAMTFDPNFNPAFTNDIRIKDRGFLKNVVHFAKKHRSEGILDAATHHLMSHLEFGGCLMEFNCLKVRYETLRKLEDVDGVKHHGFLHVAPQVRFVQYYTVCHGPPKKPKKQKPLDEPDNCEVETNQDTAPLTPKITMEDYGQPRHVTSAMPLERSMHVDSGDDDGSLYSLSVLDPIEYTDENTSHQEKPLSNVENPASKTSINTGRPRSHQMTVPLKEPQNDESNKDSCDIEEERSFESSNPNRESDAQEAAERRKSARDDVEAELASLILDLPAIPELPQKPSPPDLDRYTDKDARKQAEKEAKRVHKAYDQAVKNRDKAIKERQKIIEKRRKKRAAEVEKQEKEARKQRQKEEAAAAAELGKQNSPAEFFVVVASASAATTSITTASTASLSQLPSASVNSTMLSQETSITSINSSPIHSPPPEPKRSKEKPAEPRVEPESPATSKKDRKFCTTPATIGGQMDPKWVRIFMKDTDEVGAHTGLFFPGPHYEKLVGDVGDMIISWVQDDLTKRAIIEGL